MKWILCLFVSAILWCVTSIRDFITHLLYNIVNYIALLSLYSGIKNILFKWKYFWVSPRFKESVARSPKLNMVCLRESFLFQKLVWCRNSQTSTILNVSKGCTFLYTPVPCSTNQNEARSQCNVACNAMFPYCNFARIAMLGAID